MAGPSFPSATQPALAGASGAAGGASALGGCRLAPWLGARFRTRGSASPQVCHFSAKCAGQLGDLTLPLPHLVGSFLRNDLLGLRPSRRWRKIGKCIPTFHYLLDIPSQSDLNRFRYAQGHQISPGPPRDQATGKLRLDLYVRSFQKPTVL
jgi:hypothetical protein